MIIASMCAFETLVSKGLKYTLVSYCLIARYVSTALLYLMLASQAVGTSEPREQLSQHAGSCALRAYVVLTDGLYEILNAEITIKYFMI